MLKLDFDKWYHGRIFIMLKNNPPLKKGFSFYHDTIVCVIGYFTQSLMRLRRTHFLVQINIIKLWIRVNSPF
jgi:hypothetical protein